MNARPTSSPSYVGPVPRLPLTEEIVPDLFERLTKAVQRGDVVFTLAQHRPNTITDVSTEGVHVETERSQKAGAEPRLVPGWMINFRVAGAPANGPADQRTAHRHRQALVGGVRDPRPPP